MKHIVKFRWVYLIAWFVLAVGLMITAPNMQNLVSEKGQITLPNDTDYMMANALINEMKGDVQTGESTVVVMSQASAFTEVQYKQMQSIIEQLKADESLGVQSITTHFETEDLKEQMVSADETAVLLLLDLNIEDKDLTELREKINSIIKQYDFDAYLTGGWVITEDMLQSSQEGLKKTEVITVVFILIILFFVFKSLAAPFVPLLAVGMSYLVSQSIVAFLVDLWNFPLSTFTQIFLVAILFGIGTDYCILIISRFKEELGNLGDKEAAIIATYKSSGKTVIVAGIAVLVGFISIGFSQFSLYRSAVAVAIGVAVMLVVIYTFVPFFLYTLGKGMFWPSKKSLGHSHSRLWDKLGAFSLSKPVRALLVLAVIIVPIMLGAKGLISYNSIDEVGEKYDSVKGFNVISEEFGPGESLPTTVVVKSNKPFNTPEGLAVIEQATRALTELDEVAKVRSATRPLGEIMEEFLVADQVEILEAGLNDGNEGLKEIKNGLQQASTALQENAPQLEDATAGATKLVSGTEQLKTGLKELTEGLKQINVGLEQGTMGANDLTDALTKLQTSAKQLADSSKQLESVYGQVESGLQKAQGGYEAVGTQLNALASNMNTVQQGINALAQSYPELKNDTTYQTIVATMTQLTAGASQLDSTVTQLNAGLKEATTGLTQANSGLAQASGGLQQFSSAMPEVVTGMEQLKQALQQLSAGQTTAVSKLPEFDKGLTQLKDGQKALKDGFTSLEQQLATLTNGLDKSVDGLDQVTDGISSANAYLQGLTDAPDKQLSGWYIPQESIDSPEFKQVLDNYMSEDYYITTFDVISAENPYSIDAIMSIADIRQAVVNTFNASNYATDDIHITGESSSNYNLKQLGDSDYDRTVVFVLVGILIVLIILFRSIIIPIYIVASLLITYYTSLDLTELIFVNLLGVAEGVSWTVPFFGFVLLMALGVDYSIFLMDRFKENSDMNPKEAIHEAMKSMGNVILSAAVILGGTFAAMIPSGMMSLMQIASLVLGGLFLYAFFMLPLFIPVMVRLFGRFNWWPFMKK